MKRRKKIVSICSVLFALTMMFSLASCAKPDTFAKIKIVDMFSNEEIVFEIPQKFIKSKSNDPATHFATVNPKVDFDEFYAGLTGMSAYGSTKVSDDVAILVDKSNGTTYSCIKSADNAFTFTNSYVTTNGFKRDLTNNTSVRVGEYICFPIHFLDEAERVSFDHEFELDKEYEIDCTKEQFKNFYIDADKFNVEDTADGFLVNGFRETPKVANRFDKMGNYKFTFSQKGDDTFLVLSNI